MPRLQEKKQKGLAGAARNMWGRSATNQPVSKIPSKESLSGGTPVEEEAAANPGVSGGAAAVPAVGGAAAEGAVVVAAPKKQGGFWGYMRAGQKEAEEAEAKKMEEWNRVAEEKAKKASQ